MQITYASYAEKKSQILILISAASLRVSVEKSVLWILPEYD